MFQNSEIRLIGITGKKFNGKDTLGNYFVTNYNFKRLAFADALKEACRCIFGFTDEQLYGDKKEDIDIFWKTSPRIIFQYLGTDLFRNRLSVIMPHLGSDIWVEVLRKQILDQWLTDEKKCIVVTDVRFPNEVKMIKNLGGIVLRVKRNNQNNSTDLHTSELNIDNLNVDAEILNNDTKEMLYENALSVLNKILNLKV